MTIPKSSTPSSAKYKFAFTGTNCSGKTTMALDITARLKMAGVLAEVVSSQDRKITWNDAHFPIDYRAHYGMLCNLIHAEVQAELKGDAQVVITDRSCLDLYAIARYDHPDSAPIMGLENMVLSWAASYTKIFYLEPLPYQADNKRPNDEFRMATHAKLLTLMEQYALPNVVRIPRTDVFKELKNILGIKSNPVFAQDVKWQGISNAMGLSILIKEPASEVSSDYDVWLLDAPRDYAKDAEKLRLLFGAYFGSDRDVDVMLAPAESALQAPFKNKVFNPIV